MKAVVLFLLLFLSGSLAYGIIDGGYSLVVEISKTKNGKEVFDVENLTKEADPVKAAQWIYDLYSENKEKKYSNSVHLRFSSGFDSKEIRRIRSIFEMSKVNILTATFEENGKRVPFKEGIRAEDDLDAMLEIGGLSPDEEKALREVRNKLENAEQAGGGQPATQSRQDKE